MLYHKWMQIHYRSSMQAASQPVHIKGSARQRVCLERQTAGSTETAMNVTYRRTHQAPPTRRMKPAVDWKDMSKNEQIAQICIPWMSCVHSLLPGRPTKQWRVYTCVSDRRGPPNTHTDNVTRSYCSTPSFGQRQTPVLSSLNPERWDHLLPGGVKGGET